MCGGYGKMLQNDKAVLSLFVQNYLLKDFQIFFILLIYSIKVTIWV
jgi:hypothetical protein